MIDLAIETAVTAHGKQVRKGTDIPYITHPLAVGILLAKAGCPDEVIAAGILHDTLEDTLLTRDDLSRAFGEEVTTIVEGASEPDKTLPWEERKRHTIEFLKTAPLDVRLVACADKLHNVRTTAIEHSKIGEQVWKRFRRGRADQERYYRGLVESLCNRSDNHGYESIFRQLKDEVESFFGKAQLGSHLNY
jgi:(p)ppGpp synthase/HD superfamily hydrolase